MNHFVLVKMDEPAVQAALAEARNAWGIEKRKGAWALIRCNRRLWEQAKAAPNTIAKAVPPLWTAVERLPQDTQDQIGVIAPDAKTVGDVLRDYAGIEDFGMDS